MLRGIPIAVVNVATVGPKESSECLRITDAGLQVILYVHDKIVEDARDVGGGRSVRSDGFPEQLKEGPFPTADPCVSRVILCDEELKLRGVTLSTL